MSPEGTTSLFKMSPYTKLLQRVLLFLAVLVVARFVLEVAGVPESATRLLSSSAGLFLGAIYLGAVGPLRGGMQKFRQLLLPALLLSAWTVGWIILATIVSAVFRLERSHFASKEDFGNWGQLGRHLLDHFVEIGVFFVIVLIILAIIQTLWRWPVTVGPGALLGALVIIRYWVEAMGAPPANAAAWSSTVGVFVSAIFLGAQGASLGLRTGRQLLVPSFAIAFAWRLWILLATILSALVPFYKTHFFDPSQGEVAYRLVRFIAGGVVVEGLIAGLIVWGIAVWISRATRPATA
ncbi:MAG: hypothetical protein ACE145_13825 [Terriglobia bacterium]